MGCNRNRNSNNIFKSMTWEVVAQSSKQRGSLMYKYCHSNLGAICAKSLYVKAIRAYKFRAPLKAIYFLLPIESSTVSYFQRGTINNFSSQQKYFTKQTGYEYIKIINQGNLPLQSPLVWSRLQFLFRYSFLCNFWL